MKIKGLVQTVWLFLNKGVLVWYPLGFVDPDFFIADPNKGILSSSIS